MLVRHFERAMVDPMSASKIKSGGSGNLLVMVGTLVAAVVRLGGFSDPMVGPMVDPRRSSTGGLTVSSSWADMK